MSRFASIGAEVTVAEPTASSVRQPTNATKSNDATRTCDHRATIVPRTKKHAPASCEAGAWSAFGVSRVLFRDRVASLALAIIPLGRPLPVASSSLPAGIGRVVLRRLLTRPCSRWGVPCRACYHARGGLLP